jgi:hypothetical protein
VNTEEKFGDGEHFFLYKKTEKANEVLRLIQVSKLQTSSNQRRGVITGVNEEV